MREIGMPGAALIVLGTVGALAWEPEVEMGRLGGGAADSGRAAVVRELRRSLEAYPLVRTAREAATSEPAASAKTARRRAPPRVRDVVPLRARDRRFAARLARRERREDRVLLLENRLFVDRAFLGIDKNNRHLQFARRRRVGPAGVGRERDRRASP